MLLCVQSAALLTSSNMPTLAEELESRIRPILHNMSTEATNATAWSFGYVDATTSVSFCEGSEGRAGRDSKTTCSSKSAFAYGSGTKPFTSVLIQQLAEEGRLSLDATVASIVDPFMRQASAHWVNGSVDFTSLWGADAAAKITVRQVLHHRSGIQELANAPLRAWQNDHPSVDLDPLSMLVRFVNKTLYCTPGACGVYSSAGYTILGFVAAAALEDTAWNALDQRVWLRRNASAAPSAALALADIFFATNGACRSFNTAAKVRAGGTIHGYQNAPRPHHHHGKNHTPEPPAPWYEHQDVYNISCTQGWTCGNMVAPPVAVADFFFRLLGGKSGGGGQRPVGGGMLTAKSLAAMQVWENVTFSGCWPTCNSPKFGYGLGLMDFNSPGLKNWGCSNSGKFVGHNGLTYGFGSQSGYNIDLEFGISWVNNAELFIGPQERSTNGSSVNILYDTVAKIVQKHRLRAAETLLRVENAAKSTMPHHHLPGPGPNGLARTPPMGWMSWEVFRCETDCVKFPKHCVNEDLYTSMGTALVDGGYLAAGYDAISIDDCWEAPRPFASQTPLRGDPKRFPSGMAAIGSFLHRKGMRYGIYSDAGTSTCGGFAGSEGHETLDAATFAEWGVDYLKLDGCYNNKTGFYTAYPAMGTALAKTKRDIVYSCSWPAYLGGNESAKPWDAMIASGCNSWRNWEDIQCSWDVVARIIDHWGEYGEFLASIAKPGIWHDPDMLVIGNGCISPAEEQTQMALWSISAAPLIMGNDLRNATALTPASSAILLNADAIAIDQDSLGAMGWRVNISADGNAEIWGRKLSGGKIAVAGYNKRGGTPAGATLVQSGAYCANATGVDNKSSFGYSLRSCVAAVQASPRCAAGRAAGGFFYYSQGYNGQCTCARDACAQRHQNNVYSVYALNTSAPAAGFDIAIDFSLLAPFVGSGGKMEGKWSVYDVWQRKTVGTFKGSYLAEGVPMHGSAFLRLERAP